jgi:hypothetical protein
VIAVHVNSFRTVRGRTLVACIFDEVALRRDELLPVPDLEVYRAMRPALMTPTAFWSASALAGHFRFPGADRRRFEKIA